MMSQGRKFDLAVSQRNDTLTHNIPAKPMGTSVSTLKSCGFSFFVPPNSDSASLKRAALPISLRCLDRLGGAYGHLR